MSIATAGFVRRHRVPLKGRFKLSEIDPDGGKAHNKKKRAARDTLETMHPRLQALQEVLYAQSRHAVLVVLQAMDTGGKDGCIRHVFGPLNPQGVRVTGFKAPSALERSHDYLWRIHSQVPARGMIGVFNRSHYEDVLIARVRALAPPEEIDRRYAQINAFERHLAENGVALLKCFLHISKDEQRKRLQSRLAQPDKHWKFSSGDLAERKRWDDYMAAAQIAITRCNTPWARWHVIPANQKPYRDIAVAGLLLDLLERLDLRYPDAETGLDKVKVPK